MHGAALWPPSELWLLMTHLKDLYLSTQPQSLGPSCASLLTVTASSQSHKQNGLQGALQAQQGVL